MSARRALGPIHAGLRERSAHSRTGASRAGRSHGADDRRDPREDPARSPSTEQIGAANIIARVLGDTEDTWSTGFKRMGGEYHAPRLVLFRGAIDSACGLASSAVGPFYCASDDRVYLDRSFLEDLSTRFGAPGEFARAYVIAHEVGHHVQNQLGITEKVTPQRGRTTEAKSNALSVLVELQADCFAGVWGHFARQRNLLDPGDVEAGLAAAAAIGDDRLQQQSGGFVRSGAGDPGRAQTPQGPTAKVSLVSILGPAHAGRQRSHL